MKHVFISYIRENKQAVDKLHQELESRGVEVWLDRRDLGTGSRWKRKIREAIQQGAFFIACFSKEYHGREKTYNRGESWLHLQKWEEAKLDLTIAEDKGVDITTKFHNDYASVEEFEQKTDVQLPEDIAALLTPP